MQMTKFPLADDDGLTTLTSLEQRRVEDTMTSCFKQQPILRKQDHITYLIKGLQGLSPGFIALDASKPWLCYWILHALDLLEYPLDKELNERVIATLKPLQQSTGGFGGGINQLAHLAPTYAAVNALCIIGSEEGFKMVDRKKMYDWLLSLKQPDGSFVMHQDGEVDIRGSYCALNVASLLGILTPELANGTRDFLKRCQTYEGGLGGLPGVEAHGGYAYCGLSAAALTNSMEFLDIEALWTWALDRQMSYEGGFQGRTNKLVDGCYAFWQGGVFSLLQSLGKESYDREAMQTYLLTCAQGKAGMRDKPEKNPDYYHTCYCLSGLSCSQYDFSVENGKWKATLAKAMGPSTNQLPPIHPIYNVRIERVEKMLRYFKQ